MSSTPPQDRYLFKPFFGSSHYWALQELGNLGSDSRLLDIGAGPGAIGKVLSEKGWRNLVAVEIDPRAHALLRSVYLQVHTDLSGVGDQRFDVILLMDVLEHIPECEKFLATVLNYLAPGGTVLISVPNFAHWSVRFMLLFGFLPSMDRGILDKTHVQCFTRKRFHSMLAATGLTMQRSDASIVPLELLLPPALSSNPIFQATSKLRHAVAQIFPGLCAFQHLACLKKR